MNFKNCLFHSGAGISVSAGVGQAARGAVGFSDLTTDAKPSGDDDGGGGDLYIIGAVSMYVCQQKSLFVYSKNLF